MLRLGHREEEGRTKGKAAQERKDGDIDHLTKTYGNVTVGIHGQELPKFEKEGQEWWKK